MMEGTAAQAETLVSAKGFGFDLRAGISAGSNQSSHANLGYVWMMNVNVKTWMGRDGRTTTSLDTRTCE